MKFALKLTAGLGILDFFGFLIGVAMLGGDAISGHAAGGHYFLSYRGNLTEVSQNIFQYSRWHAYSLFVLVGTHLILYGIDRAQKRATHHGAA